MAKKKKGGNKKKGGRGGGGGVIGGGGVGGRNGGIASKSVTEHVETKNESNEPTHLVHENNDEEKSVDDASSSSVAIENGSGAESARHEDANNNDSAQNTLAGDEVEKEETLEAVNEDANDGGNGNTEQTKEESGDTSAPQDGSGQIADVPKTTPETQSEETAAAHDDADNSSNNAVPDASSSPEVVDETCSEEPLKNNISDVGEGSALINDITSVEDQSTPVSDVEGIDVDFNNGNSAEASGAVVPADSGTASDSTGDEKNVSPSQESYDPPSMENIDNPVTETKTTPEAETVGVHPNAEEINDRDVSDSLMDIAQNVRAAEKDVPPAQNERNDGVEAAPLSVEENGMDQKDDASHLINLPTNNNEIANNDDQNNAETHDQKLESVIPEEILNMVMQSSGDNIVPPSPKRYSSSVISENSLEVTPQIALSTNELKEKDSHPILGKNMRSYSTELSQEISLVEVDLDVEENGSNKKMEETSFSLVKAFSGAPSNDIDIVSTVSGESNEINSESNAFQRPSEKDAFGFLTVALRKELGDDHKDEVSDKMLSRYIHWKPDVTRATERYRANQTFRKDNPHVFDDKPLLLSQDPKLSFLLQNGMALAPPESRAKDGSAVVILRAAKCDLLTHGCSDEDGCRAIFYTLQSVLERESSDPLLGISIILDLSGVLRKNVSARLAKLLGKAKGCFPLRVKAIYVVSMPWWFPNYKRLFSPKLRERIYYLKDKSALYEYIEKDRLLEEDGGTLINFDMQSWISSTVLKEVEMSSNKES